MIRKITTTIAVLLLASVAAHAEGDVTKGEKIFRKCKACHKIGANAKIGIGPPLTGIVGSPVASFEGYKYSKAMLAFAEGDVVWDEDLLAQLLHKPKDLVKGTKMTFPGLKKDADIENVIAYLMSVE